MGLDMPLSKIRQAFGADLYFRKLGHPADGFTPPATGLKCPCFPVIITTNYVNKCWKLWADNTLSIKVDNIWWSGTVDSGTKKLKLSGTVAGVTEDHYIAWPPSQDIFLCDGVFNGDETTWPPKEKPQPLAPTINRHQKPDRLGPEPHGHAPGPLCRPGAPNRGTLVISRVVLPGGLILDPADYQTNVYAKILHGLAIDGSCYAYAYDDNDGKSTTISGQADEIILTI